MLRIVWIDDDEARVLASRGALERAKIKRLPKATVELKLVNDSVLKAIESLEAAQDPPDLILIDHSFHRAKPSSVGQVNGASAAHLLRRRYASVPIVCVTAILPTQTSRLDQEDLSEYAYVVPYGSLGESVELILAIAFDFKRLIPQQGNYRDNLLDALRAPSSEAKALKKIMPGEFKSQSSPTTPHRVARWVLNTFLHRPGFLYDQLHAATLLGLSEKGMRKVEKLFKSALYEGPFATLSRPLWWTKSLVEIAYAKTKNPSAKNSQLAGRALPGIRATDFSRCYVNSPRGDIPDVVARIAPTRELQPVSSRHTKADPEDSTSLPGFDQLLVIDGQ
jgi:CheY-like chemotaxis protein